MIVIWNEKIRTTTKKFQSKEKKCARSGTKKKLLLFYSFLKINDSTLPNFISKLLSFFFLLVQGVVTFICWCLFSTKKKSEQTNRRLCFKRIIIIIIIANILLEIKF